MINRKFGWKKDKPDPRDFKYKVSRPSGNTPDLVDLREHCSLVEDQKDLGSCTGNAIAGHLELLLNKYDKEFFDASRLFIYYNERLVEGTVDSDEGASIRDGIQTLNCYGYCKETLWPYDIPKFAVKPPQECYDDAATRTISSYHRISGVYEAIDCLADGYPFVFGIELYDSFMSPEVAKSGIVPMPAENEECLGGHAVLAVGYDKSDNTFLVRNSWGEGWGIKGYFKLPFDYVKKYADDLWTIRK